MLPGAGLSGGAVGQRTRWWSIITPTRSVASGQQSTPPTGHGRWVRGPRAGRTAQQRADAVLFPALLAGAHPHAVTGGPTIKHKLTTPPLPGGPDAWTHAALVERAARWLANTKGCKLVIVGAKPWSCAEHVDVIGWKANGESIVVECKVSRADYLADSRKPWRLTSVGMGMWRYYLTARKLLDAPPVMDVGWLELHGSRVHVVREAAPRQLRDWAQETVLLLAQASGGRRVVKALENKPCPSTD